MPGFPYLTLIGIVLMAALMIYLLVNPDLRISAYIGVPVLIAPMILFHFFGNKKLSEENNVYEDFLEKNGLKNN